MFANYVPTTTKVSNTRYEVFCDLTDWGRTKDTLAHFKPITNNPTTNIITQIKNLRT